MTLHLSTGYCRWHAELRPWPCFQHTLLCTLCSFSCDSFPSEFFSVALCTPVLSSPLISRHRKEFSISSLHLSFISQVSLSASFSPIRGLFLRHVENTGTCVDLALLRTGLLGNSPSSLFTFNTVRLLLNCPISSCLFFL